MFERIKKYLRRKAPSVDRLRAIEEKLDEKLNALTVGLDDMLAVMDRSAWKVQSDAADIAAEVWRRLPQYQNDGDMRRALDEMSAVSLPGAGEISNSPALKIAQAGDLAAVPVLRELERKLEEILDANEAGLHHDELREIISRRQTAEKAGRAAMLEMVKHQIREGAE